VYKVYRTLYLLGPEGFTLELGQLLADPGHASNLDQGELNITKWTILITGGR
jgi:hypothetical protein